jgi:hypothetical protein
VGERDGSTVHLCRRHWRWRRQRHPRWEFRSASARCVHMAPSEHSLLRTGSTLAAYEGLGAFPHTLSPHRLVSRLSAPSPHGQQSVYNRGLSTTVSCSDTTLLTFCLLTRWSGERVSNPPFFYCPLERQGYSHGEGGNNLGRSSLAAPRPLPLVAAAEIPKGIPSENEP